MKKIITSITVCFLLLIAVNGSIYAQEFTIDHLKYEIISANPPQVSVVSEGKPNGSVTIPASVRNNSTDYAVTQIGDDAFYECKGLTSVTIPNSVTKIGRLAFFECEGLTSVTIPNSVTTLGEYLFDKCKGLTSVTIPNSVTTLGESIFLFCENLSYVKLPSSITEIPDGTFRKCKKLSSIVIPNSVTRIGSNAFMDCEKLSSINIPNSVTKINNGVFKNCTSLSSIEIPNSVTNIGSFAFSNCTSLSSINIPNSVTEIGSYAFRSCKEITSIVIPNSVTKIGNQAFSGCEKLSSINIPNSVTEIGSSAFRSCKEITSIVIPNSVTKINNGVFNNCTSLSSITIPSSVTSIGHNAFRRCISLSSIDIPNSVTSIGNYAFCDCKKITSITIPSTVTEIRSCLFSGCTNLSSINILGTITSLGAGAFHDCKSLTSYTIPDGITEVEASLFAGCTNLTSVTIPSTVTKIGEEAFMWCKKLPSINIPSAVTRIGKGAFKGCKKFTSITLPDGITGIGIELFADCTNLSSINIPNSVKFFGESAFQNCKSLTSSITIPDDVRVIYDKVFYNCEKLTTINLHDRIVEIGYMAFRGCSNLNSINIPSDVNKIGEYAFAGCKKIPSITFGNRIREIKEEVFAECSSLSSIVIPSNVTKIGSSAFSYCTGLTSVDIQGAITEIKSGTFMKCSSLSSINIPNTVKKIGNFSFYNCSSLSSVNIPSLVKSIGRVAFAGCTSLSKLTFENLSNATIDEEAFSNCTSLNTIISKIENISSITMKNAVFGGVDKANCKLYVPKDKAVDYKSADQWKDFKIIEILTGSKFKEGKLFYKVLNMFPPTVSVVTQNDADPFYENSEMPKGLVSIDASVNHNDVDYSIKNIEDNTFKGCQDLKAVTISESVKTIGEAAFSDCYALRLVTIPSSVTSIGANAFKDCPLQTLVSKIDNPAITMGNDVFEGVATNSCDLYVPEGKVADYQNTPQWDAFTKTKKYVKTESISLDETEKTIGINEKYKVKVNYQPDDASVKMIKLIGNDDDIAYVNDVFEGEIEGEDSGDVTFTASTLEGKSAKTLSIKVIDEEVGATFKEGGLYYKVIAASPLSVKVIPQNEYAPYWDNAEKPTGDINIPKQVAHDNKNYNIVGIADYTFAECNNLNTVIIPSTIKEIGNRAFKNCNSLSTIYTYIKSPASSTTLGNNVFEGVDVLNCKLYVLKNEKTKYEAATQWQAFSNIIEIVDVESVALNLTSKEITKGSAFDLNATVSPNTATNKNVSWSSSNENIATVDANGHVTAVGGGSAVITVTTTDGNKTATCQVKVIVHVTGISLPANREVSFSRTIVLNPTFTPSDATNRKVNWSSSDESIAKVNNGRVTGVAEGDAIITAISEDGNKTATCNVKVTKVAVTKVELNETEKEIEVDDKFTLRATISPSNASNLNVTWESSRESVATVDENGRVKGLKEGSARITVKTADGGFEETCKVRVIIPVRSVTLDMTDKEISVGESLKLTATVSPSDASDKKITWSSSDESIATVRDGNVTALKAGTATITVTTNNKQRTATCKIKVTVPVSSVGLDVVEKQMFVNETFTLTPMITPKDATNKGVSWKSSDESIAKVYSNGSVQALKVGTATITATTDDGSKTATCYVTVKQHVESVALDITEKVMPVNDKFKLNATLAPSDASNKTVVWSSSNDTIATVDNNGNVKAIKAGKTIITATTEDGSKTATCNVTVIVPVKSVSLKVVEKQLYVDEVFQLLAAVTPENADNKKVLWSSSNDTVVTVDNYGNVKALKAGTVVITATSEDGNKTASCDITVVQPVDDVKLNISKKRLIVNESFTLIATVLPADAYNKNVKWQSSNPKIAKVDKSGKVTALKSGSVSITASTENGKKTATCSVTVIVPVTSVSLDVSAKQIAVGDNFKLSAMINPKAASNKKVIWRSSDISIVSVDAVGNVKGLKEGVAKVIVTTKDGKKTDTCAITVTKAVVKVETVSLDITEKSIAKDETLQLTATVNPSDASNQKLIWNSSDETIATVDANGLITAIKAGKATITVTTEDGNKTTSCVITVTKNTGIDDVEQSNFKLYPVAVETEFTVETDGRYTVLEIFSIRGLKIKEVKLTGNKQTVNIGNCRKGIYIVRVGRNVMKVVKL